MRRREHFGKPLQAVLCLIVAVFITGCAGDKPNESAGGKGDDLLSKKAPVKVAVVSRGTVQSWISLTATLLPIRESRVGAKVGGRVAEILADEGDSVEQGAALFKLEQRDFELARDQAKHNLDAATAGLSAANVNLENTSREFERLKGLRASNAVSQQDYDSAADAVKAARAAVHVAEASVNVARDALEVADYNLAQSTVKTFIAGQVAKRSINVGELAYPASPLPYYYIVDDSICKVEANLPDTIQSLVMESQEVKMTVDGIPGRTFSGNITYVAETIDPISRTLTIRAQVANPDGVLKCGALARLKILSDRKEDVVTAPIRCVVKRNGSPIVFIVNSGTASARKVHLGLAGEDEVEIAEGLEPSDVVVVEGTESLEDGMSVEVINSAQLNP